MKTKKMLIVILIHIAISILPIAVAAVFGQIFDGLFHFYLLFFAWPLIGSFGWLGVVPFIILRPLAVFFFVLWHKKSNKIWIPILIHFIFSFALSIYGVWDFYYGLSKSDIYI